MLRRMLWTALTLVVCSSPLAAQPPRPAGPGLPPRPGGGPVPRPAAPLGQAAGPDWFSRFDADGDGQLSAAELAEMPAVLKRYDADGDGELSAQELAQRPPSAGRGWYYGQDVAKLVEQFDEDEDGRLNREERDACRVYLRSLFAASNRGGGRRGPRRPETAFSAGESLSPDDVDAIGNEDLYSESVLRTIFIDFPYDDWEQELAEFYRSGINVPATVTVDGAVYPEVGIRFRGNSSFFSLRAGQKRSFNVSFDCWQEDQDLYGYRTLNLLNAHSDPSFLRTVLFDRIARDYIPAPQANFVRVVINGESWGVYINEQQFNKDFTSEWFGSRKGVRWKVPTPAHYAALTYNGDNPAWYSSYQLKSGGDKDEAVADLMHLCKVLSQTPEDALPEKLDQVLDVDRALWFLALDNVLGDTDGYYARGSDYVLYQDPLARRFHVLPYDSNETFRLCWSGPWQWQTQPQAGQALPAARRPREVWNRDGLDLSPFASADNIYLPLAHRLFGHPEMRARYAAHCRTICEEWLDWEKVGPVIESYRALIDEDVRRDTRKLSTYEAFAQSLDQDYGGGARQAPGLRRYITQRRAFLEKRPELAAPAPSGIQVSNSLSSTTDSLARGLEIRATVDSDAPVEQLLVYHTGDPGLPFERTEMERTEEGGYRVQLPPRQVGQHYWFYVAAKASSGAVRFEPSGAAGRARRVEVNWQRPPKQTVVINEVVASNQSHGQDETGEYEDWIELKNISEETVDLSGWSLSDTTRNLSKWAIPAGTELGPGELVLIWADEDESEGEALHANFKLDRNQEQVLLSSPDGEGLRVEDLVHWSKLQSDVSWGRSPSGEQKRLSPTPAADNQD